MKALIASPHLDDEVLGCASYLDENTSVIYTTARHPLEQTVLNEAAALHIATAIAPHWTRFDRINELDLVGQKQLIGEFERLLGEVEPDLVLIPSPSYNQDHRAVYDAMITACRPHDRNFWPKRVMAYEEPETFGSLRQPPAFHPTYFRALDIDRKLALYHIYASQVRGHRSDDDIRAIARVRGMQAGLAYAEAFEVLRWVE